MNKLHIFYSYDYLKHTSWDLSDQTTESISFCIETQLLKQVPCIIIIKGILYLNFSFMHYSLVKAKNILSIGHIKYVKTQRSLSLV